MYRPAAAAAMRAHAGSVGLLAECPRLGIRSAPLRYPMTHASAPKPHPATTYRPAWWLPNRHAQTLWGRIARRLPAVPTHRELWDTPDGDTLEVDRLDAPSPGRPQVILLHGLEGTARSHYIRGALAEAQRRGWGASLMLFRSCGQTPNRTRRFYHSGETTDLAYVVERILGERGRGPIALVGYSLGGNVLLKWLGEQGSRPSRRIRAAAAVSVPFDLARGCRNIQHGFARVYEAHFLRSLKRKTYAKLARFPDLADPTRVAAVRTLYQFDDVVTGPVHGFASADDYYARSSSVNFLANIRIPTLLLSAIDDPFLPPSVLDEVRAISAHNQALTLDFVPRGGHVGFVAGSPWRPFYWGEWRVAEFLHETFASRDDRRRAARHD
jgi:predicted alpha/beta-fold hydrolase